MRETELIRKCGGTTAVRIASSGAVLARRVRLCRGFGGKLLGLMFRRSLAEDEGALLVYDRPSKVETSIHMFFVPFPLGVFWLDSQGTVVDRVRALPWRPFYASGVPANYVLELHPIALNTLQIGDRVEFH
ncbi:MAG: DUF192 domain-containing protein [Anaerolineales bacterium]